jgi:hypothetical protein
MLGIFGLLLELGDGCSCVLAGMYALYIPGGGCAGVEDDGQGDGR